LAFFRDGPWPTGQELKLKKSPMFCICLRLGRIWPPERLQLHDPVMVIGKGKSKLPSAQLGHYRRAPDRFTYAGKGMANTNNQQFCQGLPGTTSFSAANIGSSIQVTQSSGLSQRLQLAG